MHLYLTKEGLLIRPETAKDGFELGALYSSRGTLGISFPNHDKGCVDLLIRPRTKELEVIDDLLGWISTGKGRVERIKELLEIEKRGQTMEPIMQIGAEK